VLRATTVVRRPAVAAGAIADTLTLDYDQRHRRRIAMTADGGLAFLLDLDRAAVLDEGDAVRLEDGRLVQIKAAPQHLVEIRAEDPLRLQKIIWHLGNRHVPTEITGDAVYIVEDHVLVDMVRGLGARVTRVRRPFRPEGGAYGHEAVHGHAGGDEHDHDHD
jgi:urease accessory protein